MADPLATGLSQPRSTGAAGSAAAANAGRAPALRSRTRLVAALVFAAALAFAHAGAEAFVRLGRLQNLVLLGRASDPVCSFRARTGQPCLGCGGTRALRLAGRGDLGGALRANPLGAWAAAMAWLSALGAGATLVGGDGAWLRRAAWLAAATAPLALAFTFGWWWRALPPGPLGP